ncbi:MAG: CapA family protein [Clostridia bacterium]|nr:CapA family protein [Clostridia bacterium]
MRKRIVILAVLVALICLLAVSASAEKIIKLTFTGDCTLGSEELKRNQPTSFDTKVAEMGYDYFFKNFAEMFAEDDATIINFEGVLNNSRAGENTRKTYRFRGPTEFTQILTSVSIEAAGLANNHVSDYGNQGLDRTKNALEEAGIAWFRLTKYYLVEKDGVKVALFALDTSTYPNYAETIRAETIRIKSEGIANAVVLVYHGGNEYDPKHNANQNLVVQRMIDAGVDLIIMHHPHIVQGIGIRNNRYVCYSLGNFVFGGNCEIRNEMYRNTREVSSLYALVVRAELHFDDDGTYIGQQLFLYPAFISGDAPHNDYQPHLVTGEDAAIVFDHVQYDTAFQLPDFDEKLGCMVMPYIGVHDELTLETPTPTVRPTSRPRTTAKPTTKPTDAPTDQPTDVPTDQPTDQPSNPPADDPSNPPADNPPVDNPPADDPPADNPSTDNPPADNPPADNPSADNPPADNPPADNPPADNPPADNPPAEKPVENPQPDNPPAGGDE